MYFTIHNGFSAYFPYDDLDGKETWYAFITIKTSIITLIFNSPFVFLYSIGTMLKNAHTYTEMNISQFGAKEKKTRIGYKDKQKKDAFMQLQHVGK